MSDTVALWLGERLLIGALQGGVVIALVWLMCRLMPRMPAAAQSTLWWLAALKLVLVFTPVPALPVALLPATVSTEAILDGTAQAVPYDRLPASDVASPDIRQPIATTSWPRLFVLLWLSIVLAQAGRLLIAHRALRAIVGRSVIWPGEEIRELATRVGLTRVPQVRLSEEIDTPQVCGLRKPVVLVPAKTMVTFTAEERAMVLCHELMHLRRRDLAFGWVPACAERLFFFHPLARLAARRYLDARETACDAAAVRALSVPVADYARLLVRLGVGSVRPALAAGGSPFSTSSLKRRLVMLQQHDTPGNSRRWQCATAVIAAAVIPIQLVARTPVEAPPTASTSWPPPGVMTVTLNLQNTQAQVEQRTAQEEAERTRAARMKAAQTSVEQARRLRERTQQLQQLRAAQEQEQQARQLAEQRRLYEAQAEAAQARAAERQREQAELMLDIIARARENARRNDADQSERQLKARIALLEQMRRQTLTNQHETLARQYRELAEHYERLAAEQRKLAEEVERGQREAAPAK